MHPEKVEGPRLNRAEESKQVYPQPAEKADPWRRQNPMNPSPGSGRRLDQMGLHLSSLFLR